MTPRLKHRLEYGAFRAALGALNTLPPAVARSVGAGVASFGFRPLRIRADHVRRNLERAFPEQTQEWRDRIAAESYAHLGREMIAMMQLSRMSHDELIARTEVVDYERVSRMMRESEGGTVVVGGHFGNWEIGTATMAARGYPVNLVAQRQANPLFDAYLVDARRRLGINVIERRQAPRLGLRALRRGEILVFGADQNAGRNGIFVPFFGHLASTHRGPALLALRTRALFFLAVPLRVEDGRWRLELEQIDYDPDGDVDDVVYRITADFTARLEAAIRRTPGQYLWHHRRWKTRPPASQEPPSGSQV